MSNFEDDIKLEEKFQKNADWFYINILHATNIKRINYNIDPDLQRQGWDVVITLPKRGDIVIQEKFHPKSTYDSMMVEIADVNGTKEGWANKLYDVDFVIDFSKEKTHIVNAKKLKLVAQQTRRQWLSDGGIYHKSNTLTCGSYNFYKYVSWTTKNSEKYWGLCAKIPWKLMPNLNINMKEYDFGLSSCIK